MKPCPYCNSEAKYYAEHEGFLPSVCCNKCPVSVDAEMSQEELTQIWNDLPRRGSEPTDTQRLNYFETHSKDFRFVDYVTIDGEYSCWSYLEDHNDIRPKTLREAIDMAIKKGRGEEV
tara:strand:+ start:146 stop:499 length:354 start_codon:yes stop_codon:yes gene_type:complete